MEEHKHDGTVKIYVWINEINKLTVCQSHILRMIYDDGPNNINLLNMKT